MWSIIQFPNYIPNLNLTFDKKIEPTNKKEKIKTYKESDINKHLGRNIDIYV